MHIIDNLDARVHIRSQPIIDVSNLFDCPTFKSSTRLFLAFELAEGFLHTANKLTYLRLQLSHTLAEGLMCLVLNVAVFELQLRTVDGFLLQSQSNLVDRLPQLGLICLGLVSLKAQRGPSGFLLFMDGLLAAPHLDSDH